MKRGIIVISILSCILRALPAFGDDYSLDEYLSQVIRNNPDLALVEKESQAAREAVVQARSVFFPSVGFQGSYTRNLTDIMKPTPVASLPGGGPLVYQDVDSNKDNEFSLGIGVKQKIFDASAIARYEQAKKLKTMRDNMFSRAEQQVLCTAEKLYAQTQLAQAVVEVMEGAERTAGENYRIIQRKYNAGMAAELDLLMAEVDWKSRVPLTMESRKNADIAMTAFKTVAGIPLEEPVVLTEVPGDLPDIPAMLSIDTVLAARPDYRAVYAAGELADTGRKAAAATFLPTLDGSFGYMYGGLGDGASFNDYTYHGMQLGLIVNVPLFTGGYRVSLMHSAKIAHEQAAIELMKKRNDIEAELTSLMLRLGETRERIASATLLEAAAQRALELAQGAYTAGMATQLSVSEAASRRDQARLGLQQAIYEYRAAYYDWNLATGMTGSR